MSGPSDRHVSTLRGDAATDLDQRAINVVRGIAMDAPRAARNGHSGTAMALAPLAHVLFSRILRHDPVDPSWPDRDRFVLSNGHASILLYSMLYLSGYGLTLDDLRQFRQWGSLTPGHPERHHTVGVEVTTGPLGQGVSNAVGMAVAERSLRRRFGTELCDHHTYVIAGDGCFEEGISHEAASLAGHLGLGRLICIYDDNHITIDGPTSLAYSDDVPGRFGAYGWNVVQLGEAANDLDVLEQAFREATATDDRPTLLVLRSHIGWPSPTLMDTAAAHGDPFPDEAVAVVKELLGLPTDQTFFVPDDVLAHCRRLATRGIADRTNWESRFAAADPGLRATWDACMAARGEAGWEQTLPTFETGASLATRQALKACVNATATSIPSLLMGAADLTGNTGVLREGAEAQSAESPAGSQVHYGIREHAMGGVMNGMAAHGGLLPVGGTFFVFSDYMRASVRLAALSGLHVIYSWTHDSVGLGQDGPTHQPIEHLASLRAMPGLAVVRPADARECAAAWHAAVDHDGPTALVLSRQGLPVLAETEQLDASTFARGGYVLAELRGDRDAAVPPDLVLIGTGGEVHVCLGAARLLHEQGLVVRVVSLPCWEWFAAQDPAARAEVLPAGIPRLSVEAASPFGWERYADATVAIDHFGASAPGDVVLREFGFTPEHVAECARELLVARAGGKGTP